MDDDDDDQIVEFVYSRPGPLQDLPSYEQMEDEEAGGELSQTTFDISLAARHDYLGSNLEEVRGRTMHDDGAVIWLPILLELGIVLVPGQTLPLTVFYPPTVAMLREIISKDRTFGIICLKESVGRSATMSRIGTTAEIFQYSEEDHLNGLKIKARGRQRFRLVKQERRTNCLYGQVRILPEISLPPPLSEARLSCLNRYRCNKNFRQKNGRMDIALTNVPRWILDQYDTQILMSRVIDELTQLKFVSAASTVPSDPVHMSYWVAQCLPVDDIDRVYLLGLNSAVERLQCSLRFLAECTLIYCAKCPNEMASRRDIFSMSVEGPTGTYCNPTGHVHDILTVYRAKGMVLSRQPPNPEYSWFPGYGWSIASCRACLHHTGWLFTALEPHLQPKTFWGLTRRAVTMHRSLKSAIEEDGPSFALQEFFDTVLSYV